jgi:hypothetical protein
MTHTIVLCAGTPAGLIISRCPKPFRRQRPAFGSQSWCHFAHLRSGGERLRLSVVNAVIVPHQHPHSKAGDGHVALSQGLGEVGDVSPALMPWLLRLSHIRYINDFAISNTCERSRQLILAAACGSCSILPDVLLSHKAASGGVNFRAKVQGGDSNEALKDNARGILLWKVCKPSEFILDSCDFSVCHVTCNMRHMPLFCLHHQSIIFRPNGSPLTHPLCSMTSRMCVCTFSQIMFTW